MPRSVAEIDALLKRLHPTAPDVTALATELVEEKGALGGLIGGSYAYGRPCADSDLDIVLVSPGHGATRTIIDAGSCRVDLWVRGIVNVRREFTRRTMPGTLEIFSLGVVALDKEGLVLALQRDAEQLWSDGPRVEPIELQRRESRLSHHAAIFDRLEPTSPGRVVVRAVLIDESVSYWYARQRRYRRSPQMVMEEIAKAQPEVARVLSVMGIEAGSRMVALVDDVLRLAKRG